METVYLTAGAPTPSDISFVEQTLLNKSFNEAFSAVKELLEEKHFALSDIITELVKKLQEISFPPKALAYLFKELADLELLCNSH